MKKQETISPIARRTAKVRVIRVAVFMLAFYTLTAIAFIIPLRPTYSEMESRDLAKFPTFSVETLLNGQYFLDIDTWFSDTFPFRDKWVLLNSYITQGFGVQTVQIHGDVGTADEIPAIPTRPPTFAPVVTEPTEETTTTTEITTTQTGTATDTEETTTTVTTTTTTVSTSSTATTTTTKPKEQNKVPTESNGAVLTVGDSGYEYYHFYQKAADMYIASVNTLAQQLSGVATVYDMIVPTSIDIALDPSVRNDVNSSNQQQAIAYMYGSMSQSVKTIDLFSAFTKAQKAGDYLYFRTDHHWTALGAYRAYQQFCAAKGKAATPLSNYNVYEFTGYLGSFYRDTQSNMMKAKPDTVWAYEPKSTDSMTIYTSSGSSTYPIITDVSDWSSLYKYNCFIGGDNPLTVMQNPNKTDGSACLLIKESYGNAYAPFLVEDYQTVYVLDYRYFDEVDSRSIAQFVKDNKIKDVLLLNNISATRNEDLMDSLSALVK